eukprot:365258-Chlamydomonas_euryale.AAC.4
MRHAAARADLEAFVDDAADQLVLQLHARTVGLLLYITLPCYSNKDHRLTQCSMFPNDLADGALATTFHAIPIWIRNAAVEDHR